MQMPKPLVRGLCITVTLVHCMIFGFVVPNTFQTVAQQNGGGGGGSFHGKGTGNGAMKVNIFQVPQGGDVHLETRADAGNTRLVAAESAEANSTFVVQRKQESDISIQHDQSISSVSAPAVQVTNHGKSGERAGGDGGIGSGHGTGSGTGSGSGVGSGMGSGSGTGDWTGFGNGNVLGVLASALHYRNAVRPYYPEDSIERRETGQVNVRVIVGANGQVTSAVVEKSSGFRRLDSAALMAAKRSTFYPYIHNGVAVAVMASIPYRFDLNG